MNIPPLVVGSAHIPPSRDKVKNIGVIFDTAMTLESQISKSVKSANYNLRNIRAVRNYLTPQATEQLIHAIVSSYLDNCNSLFFGLPKYQISKLQKVQSAAARLVTKSKLSASITPIPNHLHWLPVQERIRYNIYKILLITYRALKGLAPDYNCTLLKMSSSRSGLRSSSTISLSCPKTRRNWGGRSFVSAAPRLWNSLPSNLNMENTSFSKQSLKRLNEPNVWLMLYAYYIVVVVESIITYLLLCTVPTCMRLERPLWMDMCAL